MYEKEVDDGQLPSTSKKAEKRPRQVDVQEVLEGEQRKMGRRGGDLDEKSTQEDTLPILFPNFLELPKTALLEVAKALTRKDRRALSQCSVRMRQLLWNQKAKNLDCRSSTQRCVELQEFSISLSANWNPLPENEFSVWYSPLRPEFKEFTQLVETVRTTTDSETVVMVNAERFNNLHLSYFKFILSKFNYFAVTIRWVFLKKELDQILTFLLTEFKADVRFSILGFNGLHLLENIINKKALTLRITDKMTMTVTYPVGNPRRKCYLTKMHIKWSGDGETVSIQLS